MPTIRLIFIVLLVAFGVSAVHGQDEKKGEEDLSKAIELNIVASTDRDLDEIADLCESAIGKGLSEDSEKLARQLWVSTLYAHGESYTNRIFSGEFGDRWPAYRRRALSRLEKAVEVDPNFAPAQMSIARLNLELPRGDIDAGRKAVEKFLSLSEGSGKDLSMGYLFQARLSDNDDETIALLTKAIEADPTNLDALKLRGARYLAQGTAPQASEDDDQRPADEDRKEPVDSKFIDLAIQDFLKLAELEPESATGYAIVAEALASQKKYEEALSYADKVLEIETDRPEGYLLKARIYRDSERVDEAIQAAGKAIEMDDASPESYMFRAQLLYEQKKYDEALADVDKVLEIEPRAVSGFYMRGFINLALDNFDQAIADMGILLQNAQMNYRRNPNDESAFRALMNYTNDFAMFHVAAKRSRFAIQLYDQVLKEEPDSVRALRGRADAYLNIGDHDKAIADYEAALAITPDDEGILNNFAWVLSTSPDDHIRDGARSLELGLKAAELTEYKKAYILSTLASCYAESGDFELARKWATKAVELAESDEQRESLQKELDSYLKNEPWRIRESEDEDKDKNEEDK
ncbi:MAG TPA: tetratricopeptide repeat protein [Pirellulaceae bacterium]|nr:tetratricopeptide repeat protein [Pirellulaceae bacterium]HMO91744.1 tetratricopeptide repeat protein [Pirellulaceae bacterium]HMP69793.1 tetratricopeptide repeat protein [Pirellulaceae bacterium]